MSFLVQFITKDMFTQKCRFSHLVALLLISGIRCCNPQNSSAASQCHSKYVLDLRASKDYAYAGPHLLQLRRMLKRCFTLKLQICFMSY